MKINFKNFDSKKDISFETNKNLIVIYGKNGTGKTTLSRTMTFNKKYVFNEYFIYSNVFNVDEKGFSQTVNTKENFSGLWIGESIVKIRNNITNIIEKEKNINNKIKDTKEKIDTFCLENAIPFDWSQKINEILINNFKLSDEDIETQFFNYKSIKVYQTDIKDMNDLQEKIKHLNKNDLYKQLIGYINRDPLLNQIILKEQTKFLEDLNERINILKENKKIIEDIEKTFVDNDINEELKQKINDWYKIHVDKEKCLFCGNDNIQEAIAKWKQIFSDTYIKDKQKIIKTLEEAIESANQIVIKKEYEEVDKELIEYIKDVLVKLKAIKQNIEKGLYNTLEIKSFAKDIKLLEVKDLINNIINFILNLNIKELEFFCNASVYIANEKSKETKKLDKQMDIEGDEIAKDINEILKDLGLNKNINIAIDRRSVPYKFTYSVEKHKELGELSDGQKHKLALAIFISSIIKGDLSNKIIVIDDPVISLDISGYILFKQFLIKKLIVNHFKESTKLILLTHDITYLYVQLSNIFDNSKLKENTVIYKLTADNIKEIPIDYIKTDDISLFRLALDKCSNITELKCLNRITLKIFRIIIDVRLRFYGISDTSEVGVNKLPIEANKKKKLQEYSNHISKVARQDEPNLNDILNSIKYIKETTELFGMCDYITTKNIDNIEKLITEDNEKEIENDIFILIDSIGKFLKTTSNEVMKNYVEHTRVSYTRNLIGLSLEEYFN